MADEQTGPSPEADFVVDVNIFLPAKLRQQAALRAIQERATNAPDPSLTGEFALALSKGRQWQPGRTLRINFTDGDARVHDRIYATACQWTEFANLKFERSTDPRAELRVSLAQPGCWSYIGTDALLIADGQPTINFGVLRADSPQTEYDKFVLHEFGHAIGCIHEHQTGIAPVVWDKPVVYAYYQQTYGWKRDKVDFNVFYIYDQASTNHSDTFDPDSIMVYPIPKEHTLNRVGVEWRGRLSDEDKRFIAAQYPR
jgi:serralysin